MLIPSCFPIRQKKKKSYTYLIPKNKNRIYFINKRLNAAAYDEFIKNVQCLLCAQYAADDCDNCARSRIAMASVT
jgi:hypothetical protein